MIAYAMIALFRVFENINKLKRILTEPSENKKKDKNITTCASGHF